MKTAFALLVVLLSAVSIAFAAAAAPPSSRPAASDPIVTVTKMDGSTIKGRLVSAAWDGITLGAEGGDVTLRWNEVTRVSNGLTRAKVLEAFRKDHKDNLCPDCHGNHDVRCDTCKGTGHSADAVADCPQCKGELLVKCRTPKCKDGQVPCPNTCLKRNEGKWVEHDGKTVRYIGNSWFSEPHVGELIVREGDHYTTKGRCPTCDGKTTLPDPVCDATGKIPCPTHAKAVGHACAACDGAARQPCKTCSATGLKPAP